ncbi:hypothetical protein C5748_25255 [Phyllobacterium phragmitis]|uniref:Thioredoxin domain-containing protein n=1 Tax=Phyllobacterium phragmitis TaxID=2670329 RepID=A0A2S9IJP7_9HYPH|nr:thioredoxin family protein [Phyllobacterium phragmitis]PRD40739.1 hypothetical protein C5748_25255 [Phyllobacterium phragmitis]
MQFPISMMTAIVSCSEQAGTAEPRRHRAISVTRRQFLIAGLTTAAATCVSVRADAVTLTAMTLADYQSALTRLSPHYEAALVDIGAEWCAFCETIDNEILPDPGVRRAMERIPLIKVDVTRMDQYSHELLRYLHADGPPTLFVVHLASGREYRDTRSVRAFRASDLIRRLRPFR